MSQITAPRCGAVVLCWDGPARRAGPGGRAASHHLQEMACVRQDLEAPSRPGTLCSAPPDPLRATKQGCGRVDGARGSVDNCKREMGGGKRENKNQRTSQRGRENPRPPEPPRTRTPGDHALDLTALHEAGAGAARGPPRFIGGGGQKPLGKPRAERGAGGRAAMSQLTGELACARSTAETDDASFCAAGFVAE